MPEKRTQTRMFRFDQMAVQVKDKIDNPAEADVDRYVGLEHIDPGSLKIRRWGKTTDVESSKIIFKAGDIIFGKRRAYQRKLAVADFDGICSAHAMVLRPKTDIVLREFLPFFMQSDIFMDRAVKISVGGLSPTINWNDLAKEAFALPPLEEQRRIAEVLQAADHTIESVLHLQEHIDNVLQSLVNRYVTSVVGDYRFRFERRYEMGDICRPLESLCSHIVDCLHRTPVYCDEGAIAIRTTDVGFNKLFLDQAYRVSNEEYEIQTSRLVPKPKDILFSREAPMGRAAIVPDGVKLCISQRMMHFRARQGLSPDLLAEVLNSQFVQDQISRVAVGSTVLHVNVADVKRLLIPIADTGSDDQVASKTRELRAAQLRLTKRAASANATKLRIAASLLGAFKQ